MYANLSDVLADTVQNSLEAGAHRVTLDLDETGGFFAVTIVDDGKGMDAATLARAFDPFFTEPGKHAQRKVGLGLPLLKQLSEGCGGQVRLLSQPGMGTMLKYSFALDNVDLPPRGDLASTVLSLMNYPGDFELVFTHRTPRGEYSVAKSELAEAVGALDTIEGLSLAKEFLSSQESEL